MSVVSDVLIAEEQTELQPQEPIPDLNNQLVKPSEGSLTQTSEKIVIHVTDHSDTSKGIFFKAIFSAKYSFYFGTKNTPNLINFTVIENSE